MSWISTVRRHVERSVLAAMLVLATHTGAVADELKHVHAYAVLDVTVSQAVVSAPTVEVLTGPLMGSLAHGHVVRDGKGMAIVVDHLTFHGTEYSVAGTVADAGEGPIPFATQSRYPVVIDVDLPAAFSATAARR